MGRTLFALPLLSGKTEAARTILRAWEGEREAANAAPEARLGRTKMVWAPQPCRRAMPCALARARRGCRWPGDAPAARAPPAGGLR